MLESGKTGLVLKKTYEISYALWRIAAIVPERQFADKLLERAIFFIGMATEGNYAEITAKLSGLETLIRFGVDINSVGIQNANIMLEEIGNLKSAIADIGDPNVEKGLDISGFFSGRVDDEYFEDTKIEIDNVAIAEDGGAEIGNKAEIRQTAILERIRQIGNCRLSDIQQILPDASDRTIRYDLESLVQRNIIERVGTGGRSVYYRIK